MNVGCLKSAESLPTNAHCDAELFYDAFEAVRSLKSDKNENFPRGFAPDPSLPSPPLSEILPQLLISNAIENTMTHGRVAAGPDPNGTQPTAESNLSNARPASMALKIGT